MVDGHLQQQGFDSEVIKLSGKLVDATIELHRHVMNNFLPSAVKFHYQFNLRELSSITQVGLHWTLHQRWPQPPFGLHRRLCSSWAPPLAQLSLQSQRR